MKADHCSFARFDEEKKMKKIQVMVILAGFLFAAQSALADYYVRSGATGANNGIDWNNAFTALPATLERGATYYIATGSYVGYTFKDSESGSLVITIKKATIADHGTNTGWQESYGKGQATFSGKIEFASSFWVFDGVTGGGAENSWNRNLGFKIIETGDANAVIRVGYAATANNIAIRHVDMQGKGSVSTEGGSSSNDGIAIYNSASNIALSYAWLHDIGRCPVFIMGSQNTVFEDLYVSSYFGSSAVHSEVMSTGQGMMGDVTWRYNLVTAITSTGGLMWDNSSNPNAHLYVYGNIFYKPAGASWEAANGVIGGWTGGHGELFTNCFIYNNTFINIDQESLSTFPEVSGGNVAYNNLFYNCQSPNFAKFAVHDYNEFIDSGNEHSEANGVSSSGGNRFINLINMNFKPKAATAAGISLPSPFNIDPLGSTRGFGMTWDRGAFQSGGNSPGR